MNATITSTAVGIGIVAIAAGTAGLLRNRAEEPSPISVPVASGPAATRHEAGGAERLRGRDFVRLGEFRSLSGTLKMEDGEWFLVSDGRDHELHLGDHDHRAAIRLSMEEGVAATVTGFVHAQEGVEVIDIAVCSLSTGGRDYRFRADDGSPLWRGQGAGHGARAADDGGRGDGQRRRHAE